MTIHENNPTHLGDFIRLNEQWIAHYFELEEADRNLAANPGRVIEDGGFIFTGEVDGKVVSTCALFRTKPDEFELARMATDPDVQGKGLGREIAQHALNRARKEGARRIFLISNTKLEAAITLYRKLGFSTLSEGPHPVYARGNIVMELRN